jgi:hypothetical protein
MEIYTMKRPSLLLPAACAPSVVDVPSRHESVVLTDVKRAPLSQAYQVQTQAELARILVLGDSGMAALKGSTGFVGGNGVSVKTDGAGGVPPRGRPV